MSNPLLTVNGLSMRFGGLLAVDGVSFSLYAEEIFAIIGPNGAGKTTVFNCIGGFYRPSGGLIEMAGRVITGMPSYRLARAGLVRTFQNVRLFKSMTALENLLVAQHTQVNRNLLSGLFAMSAYRKAESRAIENAKAWLDKMGLLAVANRTAGNLSYGHQRRLEIARCMITRPRILMLDEPAAGLNPQEKQELQQLIRQLRGEYGISILLIEHDMHVVMGISDRILVMEHGQPIMTGTPVQVRNDERVIKAYLGEN